MKLVISPQGAVRCVYSEAVSLAAIGCLAITRGSHVEPDDAGRWFADLSPVGGPRLGPYPLRSDALLAEARWLEQHWLAAVAAPPS